jgi:hypothetical protein
MGKTGRALNDGIKSFVDNNVTEAIRLLTPLASVGYEVAQLNLAYIYKVRTCDKTPRNTSFTLESGKDYFGAVSFNDSSSPKNTFYINGIRGTTGFEIQSSDYAINTVASDNFNIGLRISSSGSQEPWGPGGRIYLVKVYNRALTQSEIKSIYDSLRGRYNI